MIWAAVEWVMRQSKAAIFALVGSLAVFGPLSLAAAQNSIGGGNPMNQLSMPEKQEDPNVLERRDAVDRQYRATRGSLPEQAGTVDPWANMRGAEEIKPAAKSAQKQSASTPKKKPAQ
jgi:hypothetical protein